MTMELSSDMLQCYREVVAVMEGDSNDDEITVLTAALGQAFSELANAGFDLSPIHAIDDEVSA